MQKIINSKTSKYQPTQTENMVLDDEPTEGSFNGITSDAVAKVAGDVGDVKDVIPEGPSEENPLVNETRIASIEEKIPSDASSSNKLVTESDMAEMEEMFLANLPCAANTLRFKFTNMGYDPTVAGVGSDGTWKKLSAKFNNVWDWTKTGTAFTNAFYTAFTGSTNIVSVIAAGNTSSITNTQQMFYGCTSLESVVAFDTSAVISMVGMFRGCTSLAAVPLFDTSSATSIISAFRDCVNVKGGALALYQQASTQTTPPESTVSCFTDCGKNTTTGAAELAQIPTSWGGTAPATLNMGAPTDITEPLSSSVIDGDDSLTK